MCQALLNGSFTVKQVASSESAYLPLHRRILDLPSGIATTAVVTLDR
jgi:hypothetical protein